MTTKTTKTPAKLTRDDIISHAYQIAEEYGGELTIRQLYYQFVARALFAPDPSQAKAADKFYKRVVNALSVARLDGRFPFNWVQDRTRTCNESFQFGDRTDVDDAVATAAWALRESPRLRINRDQWYGQETYVTVGVEKEALAAVFERPTNRLGVGLFVFRGYSSLSALYQLAQHWAQAAESGCTKAVLVYFGDHDPEGFDIPRVAMKRIRQIAEIEGLELPDEVVLERVGLTMDQIETYDPPPFHAKLSSSRYKGYIEEQGTENAWELDALRPDVLRELIEEAVEAHYDNDVKAENDRLVDRRRAQMKEVITTEGWAESAVSGDEDPWG